MESIAPENDFEQYKHNVFEVLTKNVPKDVFLKKQKDYLMLLEKCKNDPNLLGIANFFDGTQQNINFDSENIEIKNSENKGRYVVAKKSFKRGNKILEIGDPILLTVN